jgi:hypothetical protein
LNTFHRIEIIWLFQKTLQRKMYMYITERENLRYIHILDKIMWNYNITYHSFLKCSPIDVETERCHQNRVMLLHAKKYCVQFPTKRNHFNKIFHNWQYIINTKMWYWWWTYLCANYGVSVRCGVNCTFFMYSKHHNLLW